MKGFTGMCISCVSAVLKLLAYSRNRWHKYRMITGIYEVYV